jgi:phage tail sheath protein FI
MPQYLHPGVYVEEVPLRSRPIEGVSTSTVGFIGASARAPLVGPLTSFLEFQRAAQSNDTANLSLAVRGFFENGGTRCYVARIAPGDPFETALEAMADEKISVVCCPDENSFPDAAAAMAAHCDRLKDRVCILQSPQSVIADSVHQPPVHSSYAAYYYPWVTVASLDATTTVTIPPAGHVAGIYAKTDTNRGVWNAPAGVSLLEVRALSEDITDARSDLLVEQGINVLRNIPGHGFQVWGARTTGGQDSQWKYVNVRRLFVYVEQSIRQGLQWAVFEQNGPALWIAVSTTISNFLQDLSASGALQGAKLEQAYFIRCDHTTVTQSDIDAGRLIAEIGLAPTRPAEFVTLRIVCQTTQPHL